MQKIALISFAALAMLNGACDAKSDPTAPRNNPLNPKLDSIATVPASPTTPPSSPPTAPTTPTSPTPPPTETTPTSPTPPPPPPSTPDPVSGLSGLAFLSDAFAYSSSSGLLANVGSGKTYSYIRNPNLIQIDPNVRYRGHSTLKYNQPGGTDMTPEVSVQFPASLPSVKSFWYRVKLRFQPGWSTAGSLTNSANAYKIFGWGWATSDGRGTLEFTNTNEYQLSSDVRNPPSPFGWASAGNTTTEWQDGGWYDLIIHFETTSSSTTRTRMWLARDGETPVLRATMRGTVNGTAPSVDRISLGMNFNQVRLPAQTQALWYGEWEVVNGEKHSNPFNISGG